MEDRLRDVDEVVQQIGSLEALKVMGASYGCDLGRPATDAREAVQWTYLAYLAVLKDHDGAAISLGGAVQLLNSVDPQRLKA